MKIKTNNKIMETTEKKKRLGWKVKIWEICRERPVETCYVGETVTREQVIKTFGLELPDVKRYELTEVYDREEFNERGEAESRIDSELAKNEIHQELVYLMMVQTFSIPLAKVDELLQRLRQMDKDVWPLLRNHMIMWKENIDKGWLKDKNIPDAIYERICQFIDGDRAPVHYAKGEFVKDGEGSYHFEEQKQ